MNRKKILIVDDDAVVRTRLSLLLKHSGYETVIAVDGSEAVSTARREIPDLIILDISFPPDVAHGGGVPWDGFLIMDWLRRIEEAKNIPIIVITGSPQQKYQDQAKAKAAIAFFKKPVEEQELVAAIQKTIGEGGSPLVPPRLPTA